MSAASYILRTYLAKAGEGSRGGKIVGHTRSGNPIYASHKADSADYHHFTPADHAASAMAHDLAADKATNPRDSAHHSAMANSHRVVYEKVREKQNQRLPPGQRGAGAKAPHAPDNPRPEDGAEVGKVFTGRAVYADRQPHHYQNFTAAEHGDASRIHEAAAQKAKAAGNHDLAAAHGAMRHAHVQATISANRAEASLRGQDRPHFRRQAGERRTFA